MYDTHADVTAYTSCCTGTTSASSGKETLRKKGQATAQRG
jgi:hypothetical protein